METVYVFGHRRPDTDSICAAIAMANFINKTGKIKAIPCALSAINKMHELGNDSDTLEKIDSFFLVNQK